MLQMLYGIRPWLYWLSSYLWDVVCFIIPMAAFLGIFWIFGIDEFIGRSQSVLTLVFAMAAFGWAVIPFVYSFSFAFTSAPKGYCLIVMWNIVTGMIGSIAVSILRQLNGDDDTYKWELLLSFLFPTFNISNCFGKLYTNEYSRSACMSLNCESSIMRQTAPQCCGDPSRKWRCRDLVLRTCQATVCFRASISRQYRRVRWNEVHPAGDSLHVGTRIPLLANHVRHRKELVHCPEGVAFFFEES